MDCSLFLNSNRVPQTYVIDSISKDTSLVISHIQDSLCYSFNLELNRTFLIRNNFTFSVDRKLFSTSKKDYLFEYKIPGLTSAGVNLFRFDLDSTFNDFSESQVSILNRLIQTMKCSGIEKIRIDHWSYKVSGSEILRITELFKSRLIELDKDMKGRVELSFVPSDMIVDFGKNIIISFTAID